MKKIFLSIIAVFLTSFCGYTQVVVNSESITSAITFNLLTLPGQNLITNSNPLPNMDGSPYLNDDWEPGYIIMKTGDTLKSVMLRYNVYKDEMHFKADDKIYSIGIPEKISILLLGEHPFFYLSYKDEETIKKGFFEVLSIGKSCLLQHHYPIIMPANYNPVLNSGNKNKQLLLKKKYFLKKGDLIVEIDKNGKEFISAFGDKGNEIKKYVKNNKLSFKKEADLVLITNFANSLN